MATESTNIRVVVAMPGLDCHDRGAIFLANTLKQGGMEVIYLGPFNTPETIVRSAIEEDANAIALSYLNDRLYMVYFPRVVELLKEQGADILVFGGGRIDDDDKPALEELGITGLFGQGTPANVIVNHIMERMKEGPKP